MASDDDLRTRNDRGQRPPAERPADEEVAATTGVSDEAPDWADALAPGTQLGRYLIVSRLGAGGAGVVFAAFDPELDRKVAIKLLRAGSSGSITSTQGQARLMREAQAM